MDIKMPNKTETLLCNDQDFCKLRLDKLLCAKYPDFSRAYFQMLIGEGNVKVNKKTVNKSSYMTKENDVVEITFIEKAEYDLTPHKVDFEIVDKQDDFIIINKPAGLTVHQSDNNKNEITLVNGLLYYFKEMSRNFSGDFRPGIVHRLDKDTSGLMIVARNFKAQTALCEMFKNRLTKKTYLAVVKGLTPKDGTINYDIGRHPTERHKMSHLGFDGRSALTMYKTLQHYKDTSLVAARIITGRTHQIRVHFAAIGHGLLGDKVYGFNSTLISRQALHSWILEFEYKGKTYKYCKPVPSDISSLLNKLKNK